MMLDGEIFARNIPDCAYCIKYYFSINNLVEKLLPGKRQTDSNTNILLFLLILK